MAKQTWTERQLRTRTGVFKGLLVTFWGGLLLNLFVPILAWISVVAGFYVILWCTMLAFAYKGVNDDSNQHD